MEKFSLFVKFTVQEGKQNTFVEILIDAAKAMEQIEDCEIYLINTVESDPNAVFVYEVWRNKEAHQSSLRLETTQTLIQRAKPFIAGAERIGTFITKGGKGIF